MMYGSALEDEEHEVFTAVDIKITILFWEVAPSCRIMNLLNLLL
jgi:hypothetical protein